MDPALWQLLRREQAVPGRDVEAIIRLRQPQRDVPGVRLIAHFGPIATCRLPAAAVRAVRRHPDVTSLKAARTLAPERQRSRAATATAVGSTDVRRPEGTGLTGAGVVIGVVDWGLDVDHPSFRRDDGTTRVLALWDQRDGRGSPPAPYGYGQVHNRESIDAALRTAQPYRTLGYHPGDAAHGTHVADIAAGNGRAGGPHGLAPEASLVFVHLANRGTSGLATLGDSVRLLEAVDYIRRVAGGRPWVINLSMGRHGGPHDGTTLVELALDELLAAAPGRFMVQSAGNYHQTRTHATGIVAPDRTTTLTFRTHPDDTTLNELEIWYGHDDEFTVRLTPPGSPAGRWVHLGEQSAVTAEGATVGRLYHRARDPNNLDHHVDAFLSPSAPAGTWTVHLRGQRVANGRFHAWLERDNQCPHCQARFTVGCSEPTCTIGTIACGRIPLVVGAYDTHDPTSPVAAFSSSGPTRNHHTKPDLLAPGADVLGARSAHPDSNASPGKLIRKSGTSMAAPHVTGAVALCLEAFNGRIDARRIRRLILQTTQPATPAPSARTGAGYLDVPRLLAAAERQAPMVSLTADHQEDVMPPDVDPTSRLAAAPAHAFREFLYRPGDDVAAWVARHFEVLARPGQSVNGSPQRGDVLVDVPIGRPGTGTCTTILHRYAAPLRLGPGQLLLHPRANHDSAESSADAPGPTPAHVRKARRIWARLFSASTALRAVTIEDLSSAPSMLIARSDFAAWTNSPTTVYVRDLGAVDDAVWEAILYHESLHVKQYQGAGGKPPSDYTTMMRYERDAYAESARWVARTHPDQRDIAGQFRDTASKLRDGILRIEQATKNPTKRNQQCRDFLLAERLLPPHRNIRELYTRTFIRQPGDEAKATDETDPLADGIALSIADRRAGNASPFDDPAPQSDSSAALENEAESVLEEFRDLIRRGHWASALTMAVDRGDHDEARLTDLVFMAKHPERAGRAIRPDERSLANEWLHIRDACVRPLLPNRAAVQADEPDSAKDPSGRRLLGAAAQSERGEVSVETLSEYVDASFDEEDTGVVGAPSAAKFYDIEELLPIGLCFGENINAAGMWQEPALTREIKALEAKDPLATDSSGTFLFKGLARSLIRHGALQVDPADPVKFLVRLRARVCYPADPKDHTKLTGTATYPVVGIVHGNHEAFVFSGSTKTGTREITLSDGSKRMIDVVVATSATVIDNHLGYEYLQKELARHGFVSVSVETNVPNFYDLLLRSRTDLFLAGLDELNKLNTGASTKTDRFKGRLDFTRVGIMGHSRGGEVVVQAVKRNLAPAGSKYGIQAVCSVAPTDFTGTASNRLTLVPGDNVTYAVVYGSLDGDVSGIDPATGFTGTGFRLYDRATCPKAMAFLEGCNHNQFNFIWKDHDIGHVLPEQRLVRRVVQQELAKTYVGGLFRWVVSGDSRRRRLFNGATRNSQGVHAVLQWSLGTTVLSIDQCENPTGPNDLGGHRALPAANIDRLASISIGGVPIAKHVPHTTSVIHADLTKPIPVSTAVVEGIPPTNKDWGGFDALIIRLARYYDVATATKQKDIKGAPPKLTMRLMYGTSNQQAVVTQSEFYTDKVPGRPFFHRTANISTGTVVNVTLQRMETIKIPLSLFKRKGANMGEVRGLAIDLQQKDKTHVFIDSIELLKG